MTESTSSPSPPTKDPLSGKRVLVVDDEPDVCETVIELLLESSPHVEAASATRYETAREMLASGRFDAAILDIMGVQGFDLLAEFGERIPSMVLTAHSLSPASLRKAIELKARAYLPKGELVHLAKFLRVALSVDDLDDLWGIWLWKTADLVNLDVHLGPDWREGEEAEFFRTFIDRIAKPTHSVGELDDGVVHLVHVAPPLNEYTPTLLVWFQRVMEQVKTLQEAKAVVLRSGLPRGYPPGAVGMAARRLPFGLGKTWLGRPLARAFLRLRYPGIHRTRTFGAGFAVDAIQSDAMLEVAVRFGIENYIDTFYYPKPFVSLVEGLCVAGSFEMAMCAHLLVATPRAVFALPEFRLAFPPPAGLPLLAHRVGSQRAFALTATARMISAKQALQMGLVDLIVPARKARQEAVRLARRLAERQVVFGLEQTRRDRLNLRARLEDGFDTWQKATRTPRAQELIEKYLQRKRSE